MRPIRQCLPSYFSGETSLHGEVAAIRESCVLENSPWGSAVVNRHSLSVSPTRQPPCPSVLTGPLLSGFASGFDSAGHTTAFRALVSLPCIHEPVRSGLQPSLHFVSPPFSSLCWSTFPGYARPGPASGPLHVPFRCLGPLSSQLLPFHPINCCSYLRP